MCACKSCWRLLVLIGFSAATVCADEFEFHIDIDALSGAPVSSLNQPITINDRIYSRDGHFYTVGKNANNANDDRRVRFWGVSVSPPLAFPRDTAEAEVLATRLEKLGFNLVRFHALDWPSNDQYKTLLDIEQPYPALSMDNLAALDRLVEALSAHGIYVDLLLKGFYTFKPEDGYLDESGSWVSIDDPSPGMMPDGSRPIGIVDPVMIELQKRYFRLIAEHYKDHPGVALFEINNENGLIEHYADTPYEFSRAFPGVYADKLKMYWNQWLYEKYSAPEYNPANPSAALNQAWLTPSVSTIENLLVNGELEDILPVDGMPDNWVQQCSGCGTEGPYGIFDVIEPDVLRVQIVRAPSKPYYFQFYQHFPVSSEGYAIREGVTYQVTFHSWVAVGDPSRRMRVFLQSHDNAPASYDTVASQSFLINSDNTRKHTFCFTANFDALNVRFGIMPFDSSLEPVPSVFYLDDVVLTTAAAVGLSEDEDLVQNNISLPVRDYSLSCPSSIGWEEDYLQFLYDTEQKYYQEMYSELKGLGVTQPITGTQGNHGGLMVNRIISQLDFVGRHFYWDHPNIPASPNGDDWWMTNAPMVNNPGESILSAIAGCRVIDKPFVITEYSPNPNNQHTQDNYPLVAAYAAMQDIDGVFLFNYYRGYKDYRDFLVPDGGAYPDSLTSFYNIAGETRAESLMPLAANLFRRGDVASADEIVKIHISERLARDHLLSRVGTHQIHWWLEDVITDVNGTSFDTRMAALYPVGLVHDEEQQENFPMLPVNEIDWITGGNLQRYQSSNGELEWIHILSGGHPDHFFGRSRFQINTDKTKLFTGHIGGEIIQLGEVSFEGLGASNKQFGTVAITSIDEKPISRSKELLVTTIGRGRNKNLSLVPVNAGVQRCYAEIDLYGAPYCAEQFWNRIFSGASVVEANQVQIELITNSHKFKVQRLDQQGMPVAEISTESIEGGYRFVVGLDGDHTPWYLITQ